MSMSAELQSTLENWQRRYWMLSVRDRLLVNTLAVLLVVLLVVLALIKPALGKAEQAEQEFLAKTRVLQWMHDNEAKAQMAAKIGGGQSRQNGQSLMAIVTSTSAQQGLALKRYEPEGKDKLRVYMDDQSFNATVRWLDVLQKQYSVSVINVSIDASREPGLVTAKIVLRG